MIREAIDIIVNQGRDLTEAEAAAAVRDIMDGEATPAQTGALLTALRLKGETVDEIAGMARVMREKALRVEVSGPLLDTCGTGGDGSGSFNVSTAAAFVAAGAGLRVAKHGNRAMSSHSGSADVLEALGASIDQTPAAVAACIERAGIGFMFAQAFHPAMRHAAGPRREIGIRTIFNLLGPLTNPAGAETRVLGVATGALGEKLAQALGRIGVVHALVVHGEEDHRCPIGQGEQLYMTLLDAGVETEFVRYPGGSHLFLLSGPPAHREDFLTRTIAWFRDHLGGAE